jgi:hypothetical protein
MLYSRRFAMSCVCRRIFEDEEMRDSSWIVLLLPRHIQLSSWLVVLDTRNKLLDGLLDLLNA